MRNQKTFSVGHAAGESVHVDAGVEMARLRIVLEKCKANDESAWNQLTRQFRGLVLKAARKQGINADEAEDALQQTFIALHRNIDKIWDPCCLPRWLTKTVIRESIRIKRESRFAQAAFHETACGAEAGSPEDIAVHDLFGDQLMLAIERLPEKERKLILLAFMDESSYTRISRETGMKVGSIGPARARALLHLRFLFACRIRRQPSVVWRRPPAPELLRGALCA